MSRFDDYFLMQPGDVGEYVQEKLHYFPDNAEFSCREIGDGNLNYVFRLVDEKSGKSIIVKQAGETWRISDDVFLSTDRGRIEAEILQFQEQKAPGLVPKVYLYDGVMCAIIMEDMIGHTMMRTGILQHETYPLFAEHVSTYLAKTLIATSDVVLNHKEKKERVKAAINPDLCEISEDLVFSEPFLDYNHRNDLFPPNAEFIQREIYDDKALHLEAAKLKFAFMNNAQALIHGDLHTGSVFINKDHTFFFDPEFAFYGPMGYDIGNVIANLFFAWCNGDATIPDPDQREAFCGWAMDAIVQTIDLFKEKFVQTYRETVTEPMAKVDGFLEWYLGTILSDTAGMCGMESIRRIVGLAKVKDITTIAETEKRMAAERYVLTFAKDCIKNRSAFQCGNDFKAAILRAVAAHKA